MPRSTVRTLLTCLAPAGLLLWTPCALPAQGPLWMAGDRVRVSEGGGLYALALGPREVFAASATSVLAWDFTRTRWNPPVTTIGESIVRDGIVGLAYDRASTELFLATSRGDVYRFSPAFDRWDRITPAERDALSGDIRSALARRSGGRGRDPALEAVRGSLGVDARLRRWPVTDIIAGERPGEYWVATAGGGLLRFDSRGMAREWIPWGLLSRGTAALAFDGERVWFGGDGRGPRNGVASSDTALAQWSHVDAEDGAPAGFVAEILIAHRAVWFASSDGIFRFDAARGAPTDRRAWTRYTTRDGLSSQESTALSATGDVVWAGTRRGLTAIADHAIVATLFDGRPIHRLAVRHDTLWVATADGLWIVPRASRAFPSERTDRAPGTSDHAALRGSVDDVVAGEEAVYVLAGGVLYRWSGGDWSTPVRDAAIDRIAPVMRLTWADGRLWIAGARGIAWLRDGDAGFGTLGVPEDIPAGPVVDVLPIGDAVWVATPEGAFRLQLRNRTSPAPAAADGRSTDLRGPS